MRSIAPADVGAAAGNAAVVLGLSWVAAVPCQLLNGRFHAEGWMKTLQMDNAALDDFQLAAARDLGVGRREVRRMRRSRVDGETEREAQRAEMLKASRRYTRTGLM
jgi:hypothetical protein